MSAREYDEERAYERRMEYAEELAEQRRTRRMNSCVCGNDLPGRCMGVAACPYSGYHDEEHHDDE